MSEKEYNLHVEEEEVWGDDELTAIDLSAPFLLEKAEWTKFFNDKGYDGQYPFLLYSHEDAEVLHDRMLSEVNRTQMLTGHNKLQCDLYTRCVDHEGGVAGFAWLAINGTRSFAPDLLDDLERLLRSGVTAYLEHAYTSHGAKAQLTWVEDPTCHPAYAALADHLPPKSNLERADRLSCATILPR